MRIRAERTLLYRLANKLEGNNDSIPQALESLVENPEFYDPLEIREQLSSLGYGWCAHCKVMYLASLLVFSGGEELCQECL